MSIYDDIRAALETKLSNTTGIPSIAYENVKFEPTTGTSFVRCQLVPAIRRPAVRFTNPQQEYTGSFLVMCYVPENQGPNAADTLANTIIDEFDATTDINDAGIILSIRYAERRPGYNQSPWYVVPVDISWYIYN